MQMKVMVVDDEMFVRRGIVMEVDWEKLGCVVVGEADNGEDGLLVARKCTPDLIITDIRMPRMSGIDMLKTLREEGSQVHAIFLTAYSDFEYAQQAVRLLASDYLLKPFEDGELEKAVLSVKKRYFENTQPEDVSISVRPGDKSKIVLEAIQYIADHYKEAEINVGMISASLGMSEGHLSHLFKKETDYTIMNYITMYRMKEAARLLSDCRYKVYEVADMVGYKDIAYFSTTFKKILGMTPSMYQDSRR